MTKSTRTMVGSTLKYSARPPHTPANWRLVLERSRRLFMMFSLCEIDARFMRALYLVIRRPRAEVAVFLIPLSTCGRGARGEGCFTPPPLLPPPTQARAGGAANAYAAAKSAQAA